MKNIFIKLFPTGKKNYTQTGAFIEIMKEDTINDENGLTLSIFMNDYVDDLMKDFKDTSPKNILNRYSPLHYPIPETLNNEETITIPENGAFIVELSINDTGDPWSSLNDIYKTFYLYIEYPTGTVEKSELYSQLVDLFRSNSIITLTYQINQISSSLLGRRIRTELGNYIKISNTIIDTLKNSVNIEKNDDTQGADSIIFNYVEEIP